MCACMQQPDEGIPTGPNVVDDLKNRLLDKCNRSFDAEGKDRQKEFPMALPPEVLRSDFLQGVLECCVVCIMEFSYFQFESPQRRLTLIKAREYE